jgi:hypothetical protein
MEEKSREFEGDRDSILMRCRETYGFVYASEWSMGLERTSCLILDQRALATVSVFCFVGVVLRDAVCLVKGGKETSAGVYRGDHARGSV